MLRWGIGAATLVSIVMAFVGSAHQPHHAPFECVFDDPGCSTAVWTYALAVLAALAFAAAIEGGRFAKKAADAAQSTLEHERAPVLGIEECVESCPERHRPRQFLDNVHSGFVEQRPSSSSRYVTLHLDIRNLGKSTLVNIDVQLVCHRRDGGSSQLNLPVGAIASGERFHFTLIISEALLKENTFGWSGATGRLPRINAERKTSANVELFASRKDLRSPTRLSWAEEMPAAAPAPHPKRPPAS